jgi:hypothetical protein
MADTPAPATDAPTPPAPTPNPPAPAPAPAPEPQGDPADLGDAGKKALAEERRARREVEAKLKELQPLAAKAKELEDAQRSDTDKLTEKLTKAEKDGADARSELDRLKVAMAKAPEGMAPAKILSLAGRLRGATTEELEADAAELFKDFAGTSPTGGDPATNGQPAPKPDPSQGSRGTPPTARPTSLGAAIGAALNPKT